MEQPPNIAAHGDAMAHDAPATGAARLLELVYEELRLLAGSYLRTDPGHTLQPTALVHEAYLKLVRADSVWQDRNHFVATAAVAMRQILVDHARRKTAAKRGGEGRRVDLSIELLPDDARNRDTRELRVLELDDLLNKLAKADARAARVAELRLFGGMDLQQIADVLGVSRTTVVNDWSFVRAWLASEAGGRDGA